MTTKTRHVLSHGYFRTDAGVVWDTVQIQLPELEVLLDTFPAAQVEPPNPLHKPGT